MTQNEKDKLKRNLKNAVSKRGKSISKIDLEKVSEIMSPFYDDIDWEYKYFGRGLSEDGFCFLFLRFGNLNCEIEPLLDLKRIDKSVGWFMGEENMEYNIFYFKAVKIINNKSVKITKKSFLFFFTKKITKFVFQKWSLWFKYCDDSLQCFAMPRVIPSISKNDTTIFKQNVKKIFSSFSNFTKKVENEGINIVEWMEWTNKGGMDAVGYLLTWVIFYRECEEGFYI